MHDTGVREQADSSALFAAYHRAEDRRKLTAGTALVLTAGIVVAGFVAISGAASATTASADPPPLVASPPMPSAAPSASAPALGPTDPPADSALPADPTAVSLPAQPAPPPPPVQPPDPLLITVTATGYQAELDRCQWVRMDLGAAAPIVGAHTSCGGAVVLGLESGDSVVVEGQAADGRYSVVGSRDARVGDSAAGATDGMTADLILQTCYPGTGGRVRLVALTLAA